MRLTEGGVSVWYGTPDAPAPSGVVGVGGDTSVTVGVQPHDAAATVNVLYRVNHGSPHLVAAHPTHLTAGRQYYQAPLSGFKEGDKVEYVAIYHSGLRQIPSNQEAEQHVVTFTVGHAAGSHTAAEHHVPGPQTAVEDPKAALHAVLRATHVLNSGTLEDEFVRLYFEHPGDPQSFWKELDKHANLKPHIPQLQFVLQVDVLVSGHVPLIATVLGTAGIKSMLDLAKLDGSVWQGLIAKSGVPPHIPGATHEAQAKFYAAAITATLQAGFPTLTVWQLATASHRVDALALKFIENSPDFDIRTSRVDVYADDHSSKAFQGVPAEKRPAVLKEVKRLQRLFAISPNAAAFRALLGTDFGSAHAISVIPRTTFLSHYGPALGGESLAAQIHARAQFINARNLHLRTSIHDVLRTPPTRGLGHHSHDQMARAYATRRPTSCAANPGPSTHPIHQATAHLGLKHGSLHEDLVKRFPDAERLFGSVALCNCEECESAIGPSAYLVDVLDFLSNSKPNKFKATPLDVLIGNPDKQILGRRPDLAFLNLTCANANTALPYIDIVNEVLESYVALDYKLDRTTARDTGDSASADLDANPQYLNQAAYRKLDSAVYPFTLPFNRPLLVARTYLDQLGTSRHEVLRTFQKDGSSLTVKHLLAAEFLGISEEEFGILTGHAFNPHEKVHTRLLGEFYGGLSGTGSPGNWMQELVNVGAFLQKTGLSYANIQELVSTYFISPGQPVGRARELLHRIPVSYSSLTTLLKSNLTHPVEALVEIELAGITAHDLDALRGEHFERVAKTLLIDDAGRTCDPAQMKLHHFDNTPLDQHTLDRMHRFIRLYRKSGWSITDLDRALSAIGSTEITPEVIVHLAHIKRLEQRLHITNLQILLALWAPIESRGPDSLYRGLFLNRVTHRPGAEVDSAFEQEFPDTPVLTNGEAKLVEHLPALQSALRISALDLQLLLLDCDFFARPVPLNLENVSALYRRVALAKALRLKIKDFVVLRTLSSHDPFKSPEDALEFAAFVAEIAGSGLSAAQLSYIARHASVSTKNDETEPTGALILNLARTMRDGLAEIAHGNAIARGSVTAHDPSGTQTAQKLGLLYEGSVVDEFVGIVNGAVNYSADLTVLPAEVHFPPQLVNKVNYDSVKQLLTVKSPLTSDDRSALFGLSAEPKYHAAVDAVYQQPIELVKTVVSPFCEVEEAVKSLITESQSVGPDLKPLASHDDPTTTAIATKFEYVLSRLLPYLVKTLSGVLLTRTVSDSFKLSDSMTRKLLSILKSQATADTGFKTAADDLSALKQTGLTRTAYTSPDHTGAGTEALDPGGHQSPIPEGTRSVSWKGMIAPPVAGDFDFIIQTSGKPTLWVSDQHKPIELDQSSLAGEWVSKKIPLKAKQLYHLKLDIADLDQKSADVSLLWQSLGVRKSIVPETYLFPSSVVDAFQKSHILLHKTSLIINALKLTEDELDFLNVPGEGLLPLDFNELPVSRDPYISKDIDQRAPHFLSALQRAARISALRQTLLPTETKLTQVFKAADRHEAVKALAATTGWDEVQVHDLVEGFKLSHADFQTEHWILRLKDCIDLSQRLGISIQHLFHWATESSNFDALEAVGQDIKKCVQAQYDDATWRSIAKPLNDKLRDAQRNALIAFLLPRMQLTDADQLFEYFLLDPKMGVCTETSRISLAHSSVQLFVQRCLMNLEDSGDIHGVSPHQIDSDEWEKWRKHYRIWQANCQVLLYPENWMEQGIRDDKTPFFVALEGDLTQNEITAENVEAAYLNYLEKLQEVARLEIIGVYWQDEDHATKEELNILHVFGRTFHAPHKYYYRTLVSFTTWTPWQEMGVSIEGDHVMPMIWNRRLYVFWPVFQKKAIPPPQPSSIDATSHSIPVPTSGSPFWQVSLAWTELKHNKWTSKQVSKNAFDMDPKYFVDDDPSRYAKFAYSFKTSHSTSRDGSTSLIVQCVFHGPTVYFNWQGFFFFIRILETTETVGAFEIGGCNGESVDAIFGSAPWPAPITPPGTDVEALTYVLQHDKTGLMMTKAANQQPAAILHGSPTIYRLLYPHQFSDYLLQAPLFYQDKSRTFFISPKEESGPVHQVSNSTHAGFQRHSTAAAIRAAAGTAHAATASHTQPKGSARARHPADALGLLQSRIEDIGKPFAKRSGGRNSAWAAHSIAHHAHPPSPVKLQFETFYHPFVCDFMKSITRSGIDGFLNEKNQQLTSHSGTFASLYQPTDHVVHPLPQETVDFGGGPYAIYNQELFFHIPDLVFERLRQNRRYYDAIHWLRYIFDPTDDNPDEAPPERYWKYVPFKTSPRESVQHTIALLESGDEEHSQLIADWAKHPFRPYAVARHRQEAYKKNIFMKYVRTLIEHGDTLFLSDTKEAINEAQQLYIMALHLLGPRPEKISAQTKPRPECYATLRGKLDAFADTLTLLENEFPFSGKVTGNPQADSSGMQNLSRTLQFCAPQNAKLLQLWDVVEDRLFKIRNCLNIEGVFRQLSLFGSPVDPGMLVRAAAAGVDLGSVMTDMQAPLPAYRFTYMLQRALEMCNECRSFGGALLSALEKNDAEVLAVMRATHELGILDLMHRVKIRQLDEANAQVDGLMASRNTAIQRYSYYQTLMGISGTKVPEPPATIPLLPVPSRQPVDLLGIQLIPEEALELGLSTAASVIQTVASGAQAVGAILHVLPQFGVHIQPLGPGASAKEGGDQLGSAAEALAAVIRMEAEILSAAASLSGKMGTYFRRQADWTLQNNLAACEIMQIDRQIAAAKIRAEIAQNELDSHERQMENAQTVLDFMANQKFTNRDLYGWMVSETSSSYFACYQMAFALAKKAERAFRFERGLTDSNFIQFGYWDSLRKGLLAGDRLHLALLQMQNAYTDQNTREYELSRDVSLLLLAPLNLVALKEAGVCEFELPESLFDADYPGHYMRRVKSVALSIPCVVGPHTSLNCRLTLLSNKTRISSTPGDTYAEDTEDGDDRFAANFAAVQSIATSHGVNDGGLFEVNFHDDRYLPFEGAGAISRWRLELPKENNAFDVDTISDAILHLRYTAREGGEPLRQAASKALAAVALEDLLRLISTRHEYPSSWSSFLNPATPDKGLSMKVELNQERFPYQLRGKKITVSGVELFLKLAAAHDVKLYPRDGTAVGEYAAGKPLTMYVTPPDGTAVAMQLKSSKSLLNGLPHSTADLSDQTAGLGTWTFEVHIEDVTAIASSLRVEAAASKSGGLRSEAVSDLLIMYHYSAS